MISSSPFYSLQMIRSLLYGMDGCTFKCEDFQFADEELQILLIVHEGIFLMMRKTTHLNIRLYSLFNFYVEIFHDKINEDILYIKSFSDQERLGVYLEAITVGEIRK